jgi:hypothetical protein
MGVRGWGVAYALGGRGGGGGGDWLAEVGIVCMEGGGGGDLSEVKSTNRH